MNYQDTFVGYKVPENAFWHLDEKTKRLILRLLARVMESAYRRGLQHGYECQKDLNLPPIKLRFDIGLSRSRNALHPGSMDVEERFWLEHGFDEGLKSLRLGKLDQP